MAELVASTMKPRSMRAVQTTQLKEQSRRELKRSRLDGSKNDFRQTQVIMERGSLSKRKEEIGPQEAPRH